MTQPAVSLPDFAVHHPVGPSNGTTVVLLHGAFGAKEYWRAQLQAFVQNGYRVLSWDAPGYGASSALAPAAPTLNAANPPAGTASTAHTPASVTASAS